MAWYDFLEKLIPSKQSKTSKVIMSSLVQEIYFKEMALYIAISYIANAISKCEIKSYNGGKEEKGLSYFIMNLLESYKCRLSVSEKYYASQHGGQKMSTAKKMTTAMCLNNISKFINEAFENSVGTQRSDLGAN